MLCSSDSSSSRFYGLPKIHKPGISSYLARILSPAVGTSDFIVKSSYEYADFIRDKTPNAGEELVSFQNLS